MIQVTDPLAGLDEVGWDSLYHAYGPAVDVPDQLRGLRSAESAVRHAALSELYGNVYHQGTRWGASRYVVPFLVALVDDPATPDRAAVVGLLRAVVLGDQRDDALPFEARRVFAAAEGITDEQTALVDRHLQAEDLFDHEEVAELADGVAVRWAADAYAAGARHLDRYVVWLTDPDDLVAALAAELVAWFPPTGPGLAALLAVPGTRRDVRASANLTLARWPAGSIPAGRPPAGSTPDTRPDGSPRVDSVLEELLTATEPVVRVTAAVALALRLARRDTDRLPDLALDALTGAHVDDYDADVPGWDRPVRGFVAIALHTLGLN
ncbi:hypothetical protein [Plantactinospora sp. B5E13]|uniref:hypothetical protein n=1 Tax=unclassified Plantactinospora TaxID=2631981 RepID=UPI00325C99C9